MGSLKEVDIQKGSIKTKDIGESSTKKMKNPLDDMKMDKSKHENFRHSFEEVHKHLLTCQGMFNEFIEAGKAHSMTFH